MKIVEMTVEGDTLVIEVGTKLVPLGHWKKRDGVLTG